MAAAEPDIERSLRQNLSSFTLTPEIKLLIAV
jgi:hypothetical protein